MAYRILALDLTNARDKAQIVERDVQVRGVSVLALPAGADAQIAFGPQADIPLFTGMEIHGFCPPEIEGVFLTNTAQPGVQLQLYVDFSGSRLTSEP